MRKIARKIILALLVSISLTCLVPGNAQAQGKAAAFAGSMPGSFADLVQNLLPAVVNISSTQKMKSSAMDEDQNPLGQMPGQQGQGQGQVPGMPQLPPGSPFEDFLNQFMQKHGQNMPMVPAASLGSGFIIDADKGYVITNNHVVDDADEVRVTLHDDTTLPATVIGRDEKIDIAVLQIKPEKNVKLSAVKFGDSSKSRIGDWVLAIGNPFGLGGTVTAGIVSAESRDIGAGQYDDFIQTDASINRGNSGGPMFNVAGDVIGINTAIFSPTGGSVGIGFAVPSNLAKPVIDQIIKFGHTRRGWIGVRIQAVTPDIAESLTLPASKGALIASVTNTGPAQKAGLQPGDVILNFDGKEINAMRSLPLAVAETEIGKNVKIGYWREGKKGETSVVIGELEKAEKSGLITDEDNPNEAQPPSADQGVKVPDVGMVVGVITPADRNSYNIPDDVKGVLVMKVTPMSEAAKKGMEAGDVIVEIAKQRVSDPSKVPGLIASAIKAATPSALLLVNRGGDVRFVALKPEPAIEKTKATKDAPKAYVKPDTTPDLEPDAPTEQ